MGANCGPYGAYRPENIITMGARRLGGGEGGIRTPGPRKRTTVFKTAAFDHSATSPEPEFSSAALAFARKPAASLYSKWGMRLANRIHCADHTRFGRPPSEYAITQISN